MIPLNYLYDEYIDLPKLSEQKNPFDFIVPRPTSGVRKNALQDLNLLLSAGNNCNFYKKFISV